MKQMYKIKIAKTSGFCFGVNRAINMIFEALERGKQVSTLGPIIHNAQMVNYLSQKGVSVIENPSEGKEKSVVIRSHGVPQKVYDELISQGINYIDATCPFIANIHKCVRTAPFNSILIIAGDENHPEILGIIGHCNAKYFVVKNSNELEKLLETENIDGNNVILLSQTTFNIKEWEKCCLKLKKV